MSFLEQYSIAEALEQKFGDPLNPDNIFYFKNCVVSYRCHI